MNSKNGDRQKDRQGKRVLLFCARGVERAYCHVHSSTSFVRQFFVYTTTPRRSRNASPLFFRRARYFNSILTRDKKIKIKKGREINRHSSTSSFCSAFPQNPSRHLSNFMANIILSLAPFVCITGTKHEKKKWYHSPILDLYPCTPFPSNT